MGTINRKVLRQQLIQSAVLRKIERDGLQICSEPVRQSLATIRLHVRAGPLMNRYLAEWDEIIRTGDLDSVRRIVTADDDHAREMRNLSPLSVLLDENDRIEIRNELSDLLRAAAQE
ncbi:hypothetical protein [Rhodococcus pyridinivorans]|uniref:hypothetical protein n=1 Tax=Rhodococcus pyridinivorans TaxID=103816 RepID=UPI00265B12EC|nr:hypothetical protein [Rhodococcus pyridinivorans]